MELFSIKLPLIRKNDPLIEILLQNLKNQGKALIEGDIIVIAEKVIATSQGRVVSLANIEKISEKAHNLAKEYDMDEGYVELIIQESSMILGGMRHVILAKTHDFLIANAGIDQSNAGEGNVVLLPSNLKKVVWDYWKELKKEFGLIKLGVILSLIHI